GPARSAARHETGAPVNPELERFGAKTMGKWLTKKGGIAVLDNSSRQKIPPIHGSGHFVRRAAASFGNDANPVDFCWPSANATSHLE
ncbi:MAG: hypothetical protein VX974_02910, partial [Pseudomonadota bacterium]|nr:hypothetical protein [Pseudomonadota bacterium]